MKKVFGIVTGVVLVLGLVSVVAVASTDTTLTPIYHSQHVKDLTTMPSASVWSHGGISD
ncbi:hypothetical protein [Levilactobacillus zymae]|uniref:hypothetical protein n=1 Tax=Levilactobacillus zymae TaxID=267363 RepID=UPI0028B5347D|nr:hypothetical protein [Levilactobacillus zymae]MDT6981365.1 hypothetical protein [Levilactobacillus zymae]